MAQHVVGGQRVRAGDGEAARGHHLVDIAVGDVAAHLLHNRLEVGIRGGGHGAQDRGVGCGRGRGRSLLGCSVDGGGQRIHAPLQARGVDRGPHQGRLLRGVVHDEDDARVVEEVVRAGVGALGHLGQGLEGGQVVEGEGPRLQRQVGMVDLSLGQHPQGLDRGQGRQALALLEGGVVVGAGGQGEGQPVGGVAGDVLAQALLQTGQGCEAIGARALAVDGGQRLGGDGPVPAGQPGRGLQDGDRGARDLRRDVGALQQHTVHGTCSRVLVCRIAGGAQQARSGEALKEDPAVGGVAHRAREDSGRGRGRCDRRFLL